jgi:hypothetical protein
MRAEYTGEHTSRKRPALIANIGGTVPDAVFVDTPGLPTLWIPHSYPACSRHALMNTCFRRSLAKYSQ